MNIPAPRQQSYEQFIASKAIRDLPTGFEPGEISEELFGFQSDIVRWGCRRGRAAIFADCGLGKTPMQLAWAQAALEHSGENVLILAPLGVTHQTERQGVQFGIDCRVCKIQGQVVDGITITNYEKLHRFDLSQFGSIVIDESSILKSYDGATKQAIIDASAGIPNRLACTATPAPNDFMELGNHAEFLGVMSRVEMLATFFVHDGGDTAKWRLKGHAEQDFWKWICSWAVNVRRPSDLGYPDEGFALPPLNMREHIVSTNQKLDGFLFPLPAQTLQERRSARRNSLDERVDKACEIAATDEQYVFWCNLNDESEAIADKLGAVEVRGSTSEDERERIILGFLDGTIRRIVSKPSLWGFGLNLQCCHNTVFVGISDSYEQFYQAIRRFWRFGQTESVNVHVVISELEGAVLANIKRKEADAARMANEMITHMRSITSKQIKGSVRETEAYNPQQEMRIPEWIA